MGVKMISFEGGCIHTAIDDFEIRPTGKVQTRREELRRLLAFGGVDRLADGSVRAFQSGEERLFARRDGWRLMVWTEGEADPPRDPRPAPPDAARDHRAQMMLQSQEQETARCATLRRAAWSLAAGILVFLLAAAFLSALVAGR
jgi:hypothetical protein